jgi:hypothetical protein
LGKTERRQLRRRRTHVRGVKIAEELAPAARTVKKGEPKMLTQRLSEVAINARIVPRRVRWPGAGADPAWAAAHGCVHAYENVVRDAESRCMAVEQNLAGDALRHRRVEIREKALAKLVDFRPLEVAQKALSERIRALESLDNRTPEQVKTLQQQKQALGDLQNGIDSTRRAVVEVSGPRTKWS